MQWSHNNKTKLCYIVEANEDASENSTHKVRILNSENTLTVPPTSISPVNEPEPSDVLGCPEIINAEDMTQIMSRNKIRELCATLDSDYSDDESLFLH